MQKKLLICSSSTKKYSKDFEESEIFTFSGRIKLHMYEQFNNKYDKVTVIGGGGCVDLGKIASKSSLVCYPTTASGACQTSHSVVWNNHKKKSIKTMKPTKVVLKEEYFKHLPFAAFRNTYSDAVSHNLDVLYSSKKTTVSEKLALQSMRILKNYYTKKEVIIAGNLAGDAIEITPTTLLHSLSYPITGRYEIPHGEALGIILKKMKNFYNFDIEEFFKIENTKEIDFEYVVEEAYKYEKINNFSGNITKQDVLNMLKRNN